MAFDRPVATLAVSQTLVWAGFFYSFPATLLRWEADLGWSKAELTLAFTLAVLASAIGAPISGKIIDRGHGARLMGAATVLGGLALMVLSQVQALPAFYTLWIVIGLAMSGSLYDACFALITHVRGATARPAIVRITLVAGLAGTVSFPVVHVLSDAMGWRMAFALISVAMIVCVAPMQYLGARGLGAGAPSQSVSGLEDVPIGRNPVFWLLGLGFACIALVHGATLQHLLPMLTERGVPLGFAVLVASLVGPMQVVGRLVMVALERTAPAATFLYGAFAVMAAAITLLLLAGDNTALILCFVLLFGSAWGLVSILRPVIARELLGQANFGSKSGYLTLIFQTSVASSALFGALIWSLAGYETLLVVLIGLAALGAGLFRLARRFIP